MPGAWPAVEACLGECVDAEGSSGLTGDLSESTVQILNGGGVSELITFWGVSDAVMGLATHGCVCFVRP